MSESIKRMKSRRNYLDGLAVMGGVDAGDFVPWLSMVGKVAGGLGGGNKNEDAVKKALEEQKAKEAAQAASRRSLLIGLGVGLGTVVFGGLTYAVLKK